MQVTDSAKLNPLHQFSVSNGFVAHSFPAQLMQGPVKNILRMICNLFINTAFSIVRCSNAPSLASSTPLLFEDISNCFLSSNSRFFKIELIKSANIKTIQNRQLQADNLFPSTLLLGINFGIVHCAQAMCSRG